LIINEKIYITIKKKYIKKNSSKEEYFWQIVVDEIKKWSMLKIKFKKDA